MIKHLMDVIAGTLIGANIMISYVNAPFGDSSFYFAAINLFGLAWIAGRFVGLREKVEGV